MYSMCTVQGKKVTNYTAKEEQVSSLLQGHFFPKQGNHIVIKRGEYVGDILFTDVTHDYAEVLRDVLYALDSSLEFKTDRYANIKAEVTHGAQNSFVKLWTEGDIQKLMSEKSSYRWQLEMDGRLDTLETMSPKVLIASLEAFFMLYDSSVQVAYPGYVADIRKVGGVSNFKSEIGYVLEALRNSGKVECPFEFAAVKYTIRKDEGARYYSTM